MERRTVTFKKKMEEINHIIHEATEAEDKDVINYQHKVETEGKGNALVTRNMTGGVIFVA